MSDTTALKLVGMIWIVIVLIIIIDNPFDDIRRCYQHCRALLLRLYRCLGIISSFLLLGSCSQQTQELALKRATAIVFGDPDPTPFTVSIVIDRSSKSYNATTLRNSVEWALPGLVRHPFSRLFIFDLGDAKQPGREIYSVSSKKSLFPSAAVVKQHDAEFRQFVLDDVKTVVSILSTKATHTESRLVEAIASVGEYEHDVNRPHIILLLSDMQQFSAAYGRFTCGHKLPSTPAWKNATRDVLLPVKGSVILSAYTSPLDTPHGENCKPDPVRYARIRELWTATFAQHNVPFIVSAKLPPQPITHYLKEKK